MKRHPPLAPNQKPVGRNGGTSIFRIGRHEQSRGIIDIAVGHKLRTFPLQHGQVERGLVEVAVICLGVIPSSSGLLEFCLMAFLEFVKCRQRFAVFLVSLLQAIVLFFAVADPFDEAAILVNVLFGQLQVFDERCQDVDIVICQVVTFEQNAKITLPVARLRFGLQLRVMFPPLFQPLIGLLNRCEFSRRRRGMLATQGFVFFTSGGADRDGQVAFTLQPFDNGGRLASYELQVPSAAEVLGDFGILVELVIVEDIREDPESFRDVFGSVGAIGENDIADRQRRSGGGSLHGHLPV